MSYDVSIAGEGFNYTYNLSALFHEHIAVDGLTGLQALDGLTGKQAVAELAEAFDRIEATRLIMWEKSEIGDRKFCERYDAKNGWGSTVGALCFLAQIMSVCAAKPRHRVSVS